MKALDEVEGIERYRISSIEPNLLTDEIIEYVSRSRRFMPHFHIPLQSGSDEVLKLMRRRYDTALFASKIKKIKEVMPDSFIGVDVIVGTRGETEEYFGQAYEFIKGLDVTQLHVFSYSERPGTQALKIDHVVAPEEKHRRSSNCWSFRTKRPVLSMLAISDRQCRCCWNVPNPDCRCTASLPIISVWKSLTMQPWTIGSCLCAWAISMPTAPHSWE